MRKNRKYFKTHMTRPRKAAGAKARRQRDHRKRLIGLGVDEEVVAKMNTKEVRDMLKYPAKVVKQVEAANAES